MLCFEFLTTCTGKGYDSQILFLGIIYYNFVPSTNFEGKRREYLRHIMAKMRREFEY